jgi:hypothetical protein
MSRNLNDQNKHLFVVSNCNEWGLLSSHCLVWDWPKLLFYKLMGMQIVVFYANINSLAARSYCANFDSDDLDILFWLLSLTAWDVWCVQLSPTMC